MDDQICSRPQSITESTDTFALGKRIFCFLSFWRCLFCRFFECRIVAVATTTSMDRSLLQFSSSSSELLQLCSVLSLWTLLVRNGWLDGQTTFLTPICRSWRWYFFCHRWYLAVCGCPQEVDSAAPNLPVCGLGPPGFQHCRTCLLHSRIHQASSKAGCRSSRHRYRQDCHYRSHMG